MENEKVSIYIKIKDKKSQYKSIENVHITGQYTKEKGFGIMLIKKYAGG